jgi:serine/threonine protein kinase
VSTRRRDEWVGKVLAQRYTLLRELGRGGMSSVYAARDARLSREVAIKVLSRALGDMVCEERFLREVRIVSQMDHPAIPIIHDFGRDDDLHFFVMPLLRGTELRTMLNEERPSMRFVIDVAIEVARALEYAHTRGVVHRDVKPENVMLLGDMASPRVVLMDFGIAMRATDPRVTDAGAIAGTPSYISVEQLEGDEVDGRTDVYALGVVMYECIVGEPPFVAPSLASLFTQILNRQPERLQARSPNVSDALDELVMACLSKRRENRPSSAHEVVRALEGIRAGRMHRVASPTSRPPPSSRVPADGDARASEALGDLLLLHGEYAAAKDAFDLARASRRNSGAAPDARDEARHALKLATVALKLGRYEQALQRSDFAATLVEDTDTRLAAELDASASLALSFTGRVRQALARAERGFARIGAGAGAERVRARLHRSVGNAHATTLDFTAAAAAYEQGLACCDPDGDRWEHSVALFNLADANAQAGRIAEALALLERAVREKLALGDRWGLSYARLVRARIEIDRGDVERGMSSASAGLALARELGDPKLASTLHATVARVLLSRAEHEPAAESVDEALAAARACNAVPEILGGLLARSAVEMARARFVLATEAAMEAEELANEHGLDAQRALARAAGARAAAQIEPSV